MSDATIVPENSGTEATKAQAAGPKANDKAERLFSKSVMVSGVRCLLTYLVFPFVAPLVGVTNDVGAVIGVLIGLVAIAFNMFSIRRLFAAKHPYRYWAGAMNAAVIVLLVVLFVLDSQTLLG